MSDRGPGTGGDGRPAQRVAVVGAGVSGLTVAYELVERGERLAGGIEVLCLEAADRAGGNVRTTNRDGFCCEWAANGFLDSAPATVTLVRRLGLAPRQVTADESFAVRWIWRAGKLRRVPGDPVSFLRSDVLPLAGRLRVLAEPLVPRRREGDPEESVRAFAARRIGSAAASVLVDAMVSGIHAGDARRLSLPATFPKMREMEREHGSLFRAMRAQRRQAGEGPGGGGPAGPGGRLTSFRGGMQELTDALAAALGPRVRLASPVERISDLGQRGVRIHPQEGPPFDVDAAVLALPAREAAGLVAEASPEMSRAMAEIPSAPVAVAHLGFRRDALGRLPEGFGFLVPRRQGVRILGALFASNLFEGRAPDGSVLFTVMLGGAHDPGVVDLDERRLLELAAEDLHRVLDVRARPYFTQVFRHRHGIPQYTLGHPARLAAIERECAGIPGLWLTGNSYHGVSINACVEEAPRVAEGVLEHLGRRSAAGDRTAFS